VPEVENDNFNAGAECFSRELKFICELAGEPETNRGGTR
jgi:hypothetical protein